MTTINALPLNLYDWLAWILHKIADKITTIKENITYGVQKYNNRETSNNILNDDIEAFPLFFKEAYPRLLKKIMHLTKDQQLAEDLIQEAVYKFLSNKKKLKDLDSPMAYLTAIAKRNFLKYQDRKKINPVHILNTELPDTISVTDAIHTKLDVRLLRTRIEEALGEMSPMEAKIYRMVNYEYMSFKEIMDFTDYGKTHVYYLYEKASESVCSRIGDFSGILSNIED